MKLEEILEKKLPVYINQTVEKERSGKILIPDNVKLSDLTVDNFLKNFTTPRFNASDFLDLDKILKNTQKYCLSDENNQPTLLIKEAVKTTPSLKIPYLELNPSSDTGVPIAIFIIWVGDRLEYYIPRKGNTLRLDNNSTLENSGIHNFDWENKVILEKSDLLYIMKEVSRPALSKYKLKEIYQAFQNYDITEIVDIDRNLCVREFESRIQFCE